MPDSFHLISISGPDAEKFLQGQLTCDIKDVKSGKISFGAYCNVKGRVVATFHIFYDHTIFYLKLPEEMLEKVMALLRKYGAFSKVKVEKATYFVGLREKHAHPNLLLPMIYLRTSERFTPHMLNLPELGAVSFTKGCYLGQEVIARTEYLGKAKRHLKKLNSKTDTNFLPGDEIKDENNNAGVVINATRINNNEWLILAVF